CQHYYDNPLTF
nr:immunoglobulin light chain junction region [Macaca mulatta]MOV63313.1 immunoglobulin light chain junction region [Macaca mulatta]MOV64377.1 immunoglobulin light chain junction region [Macaca mulatta]